MTPDLILARRGSTEQCIDIIHGTCIISMIQLREHFLVLIYLLKEHGKIFFLHVGNVTEFEFRCHRTE